MAQTNLKTPTREAFDQALSDLREANIKTRHATAVRDENIRKLNLLTQPELDRLADLADQARDVIQRYTAAHRESLLQGAKSARVNGVAFGWRLSTPSLVLKEGFTDDKALALVRKKLPDCIRKTEALDKTLLKKYATATVAGAKAVAACGLELSKPEEKFFAEPETAA